jgi:hypothetical protein
MSIARRPNTGKAIAPSIMDKTTSNHNGNAYFPLFPTQLGFVASTRKTQRKQNSTLLSNSASALTTQELVVSLGAIVFNTTGTLPPSSIPSEFQYNAYTPSYRKSASQLQDATHVPKGGGDLPYPCCWPRTGSHTWSH